MANEEQLKILLQGVRVWNVWRRKDHPEIQIDLRGAILREAKLSGMTLKNADLSGANLSSELVASFVNRSNLLKLWKKTDPCAVSASGAYEPKNAAITRIPAPYAATESHHFSDRTALV